jgi:hypothetical protein
MNLFQNLSEKKSVEINLKEKLYLINSKKNYRFHIFFYSELSVFLFFINNKIKLCQLFLLEKIFWRFFCS